MFTHRCATHENHHRIKQQFFKMLDDDVKNQNFGNLS